MTNSSCHYQKLHSDDDDNTNTTTISTISSIGEIESITMDRLGNATEELAIVQTTNMCCYFRKGCFRPSLHWVLNEHVDQFQPQETFWQENINSQVFHQSVGGWIHEEADFLQRCFVGDFPGSRETRFVQHAGRPPTSLTQQENAQLCYIQLSRQSPFLTSDEMERNIVAIHEKEMTLPVGVCCCCYQPYMTSMGPDGTMYGETRYICDECWWVPKFHVYTGKDNQLRYVLRPDTCCAGVCVRPRCGGGGEGGGKCVRVPYLIRDPETLEPLLLNEECHATTNCQNTKDVAAATTNTPNNNNPSQVTFLWSGWTNEVVLDRHAYHVAFPANATPEEKATLIGAALLVDVALYEQSNDKNE
mmetsp:Transcript_10133/g.15550  ORF Transcript_10133/g.15550 Transcript_10133/m.15550 type:complete len:360 (-) Transcript_10133:2559-3638(-)